MTLVLASFYYDARFLPIASWQVDATERNRSSSQTSSSNLSAVISDERETKNLSSSTIASNSIQINNNIASTHKIVTILNPEAPVSLVIMLSGEFGNHLHHLAQGHAIRQIALRDYGIATELALRYPPRGSKYPVAKQNLHRCFPNLRSWSYEPVGPAFYQHQKLQQEWLAGMDQLESSSLLTLRAGLDEIHESLRFLQTLLKSQNSTNLPIRQQESNISLPFLYDANMVNRQFMDLFYDDFRDFFYFNNTACCKTFPYPEESVFVSHLSRH